MKKYLLKNTGHSYKGCLHTHSTISDGHSTPTELKNIYKNLGYSFLVLTDHDIFITHQDLDDEDFIFINGHESETSSPEPVCRTYHLNFYAPNKNAKLSPVFKEAKVWGNAKKYISQEMVDNSIELKYDYNVDSINEVIALANKHGWLVSYNHPVWSTQSYPDYIGLKGLWGVEVYNGACVKEGFVDTAQPLVDLNSIGEHVFPLATDDAHKQKQCGYGWVMVNADSLTYENIFNSLRNGDFYSSTGPQLLEISLDEYVLNIKTSPVKSIIAITDRRYAFTKFAENELITSASFDLIGYLRLVNEGKIDEKLTFIRIEVIDEHGNKAWSRCYTYPELVN